MFTTLALITAFFAILIGLKAASRISLLEKELSKLQKEVASLRVSTRRDSKLEASQPEPDTSESSLGAASSMRSDSGDSALSAPSNIEPEFEPSYLATQQHHS
ncbi:DUF2339 domain-containing protein, partial [Vibrio parahaemolyticus]|nr:DUF2339 domain-containing protein [Vibrio parahaemolyticus]